MTQLEDYSGELIEGEFEPAELMMKFSKEKLTILLNHVAKLYMRLSGDYENVIAKRWGQDSVAECTYEAFKQNDPLAIKWFIHDIFKIGGNDVVTFMKWQQVHPAVGMILPTKVEVDNPSHGILTIPRCPVLEYFERTEHSDNIEAICSAHGTDWKLWQDAAKAINPRIKVIAMKVPPRENKDEIACQWEVKLEA